MSDLVKQLLVVIFGGGGLTIIWQWLREKETKRQAVLATLRDQASQLDEHYRTVKQIKRMIRSRSKQVEGTYEISADFFRERMDTLSNYQLKIEMACNAVRSLGNDILRDSTRNRIVKYVNYSADYLNDVIEEYEKRQVISENDVCRIGPECPNIRDFLGPRWKPVKTDGDEFKAWSVLTKGREPIERPPSGLAANEEALLAEPPSEYKIRNVPHDEIFVEFERLKSSQKSKSKKAIEGQYGKTKSVSDACMLQAMRELRDEITMSEPLVSFARLRRWQLRRYAEIRTLVTTG